MFSTNKDSIDRMITKDRFPGFISEVARIKNNNRKNAEAATHAGTISIITPLNLMMLSATVVGENMDRILLEV